jgi:DNA-binding transcriptional LysR family regulator
VIAQAVQMISSLDALSARLDAERHGHRRIYRVGATPNPALRLIPGAYLRAREKFPDLVVELVEASTDELLTGVRRGEYSLVVARSTPQDSLSVIRQTPLYPEVGVVVGRAGIRRPAGTTASCSRCSAIRGCCRSSVRRARRSNAPSCARDAIRRCRHSSITRRSSSATC